jgi:hypothetical protein
MTYDEMVALLEVIQSAFPESTILNEGQLAYKGQGVQLRPVEHYYTTYTHGKPAVEMACYVAVYHNGTCLFTVDSSEKWEAFSTFLKREQEHAA